MKESSEGLITADCYPNVGEQVSYAGFPLGKQLLISGPSPTYSEGVIGAQIRQKGPKKQIQITGPVAGGFSGAPVVMKSCGSKIVGVLSDSPSKEAGDANIFMAVSWQHVKALADLAIS